jgi:hypothetical protein
MTHDALERGYAARDPSILGVAGHLLHVTCRP